MSFKVILSPRAYREVDEILCWLRQRSVAGAASWDDAFCEAKDHLNEFADGCGLAPEDARCPETVRQQLFKTRKGRRYRALFIIRGQIAYVFSVRGPGQDLLRAEDIEIPDDLESY